MAGPAPGIRLKSVDFRRERETSWKQLDGLLRNVEVNGLTSLSPEQRLRLPILYRGALSSLSVARAISLDHSLVLYLEGLTLRAYFAVYGVRSSLNEQIAGFFSRDLPRAIRAAAGSLILSAGVLFLGVLVAYLLTSSNSDWYYTFIPEGLSGGRTPASSTEFLRNTLYQQADGDAMLSAFASYLFSHNSQIGILAFATGFALGIPTLLLMFYNGLTLGAFLALFAGRGLGVDVGAWLSIHGTTEILAIILCGGAGLMIGGATAFPGNLSRLDSLMSHGRSASVIVLGAIFMLLIAGILEGFGRQLITSVEMRYAIGLAMLVIWAGYFMLGGHYINSKPMR